MSENPIAMFVTSFEKLIRAVISEELVKRGLTVGTPSDHFQEDIEKARKEIADGLAGADETP